MPWASKCIATKNITTATQTVTIRLGPTGHSVHAHQAQGTLRGSSLFSPTACRVNRTGFVDLTGHTAGSSRARISTPVCPDSTNSANVHCCPSLFCECSMEADVMEKRTCLWLRYPRYWPAPHTCRKGPGEPCGDPPLNKLPNEPSGHRGSNSSEGVTVWMWCDRCS